MDDLIDMWNERIRQIGEDIFPYEPGNDIREYIPDIRDMEEGL